MAIFMNAVVLLGWMIWVDSKERLDLHMVQHNVLDCKFIFLKELS